MAYIVNLYKNVAGDVSTPIVPGVAAFIGSLNDLSNWNNIGHTWAGMGEEWDIYTSISPTWVKQHANEITISGGQYIYDGMFPQGVPNLDYYDTLRHNNGTEIYNPQFFGAVMYTVGETEYYMSIEMFSENASEFLTMQLRWYTQTPNRVKFEDRETWAYASDSETGARYRTYYADATHKQTKMYKCTVGGRGFYAFMFGVAGDNTVDTSDTVSSMYGTSIILVPTIYFTDAEPMPWIGPPSEDDSEEGFEPTEEKHDVIEQRELTDKQRNPFGINAGTGTGIKVVFPNLQGAGVLTKDNYLSYFLGCVYRGEAQGVYNRARQVFADTFGGNTHRPADEVNAMISAIICCHSIPWIANYASGTTTITSLGGYDLDLRGWGLHYYLDDPDALTDYVNKASTLVTPNKTIFDATFISGVVRPKLNCFLDYEPYTNMTLQIPFFKPISLSPSMVYGRTITVKYRIDILTGLLQAAVYVGTDLVEIMSTNVKTDIPIIGQGANGNGLSKIMTAISSMTGSTSKAELVAKGVGATFETADAISNAKVGTVIGKEGNPALSPYLSPRTAYLMTTHPKAAIPVAQKDGKFSEPTFLNQVGMRANLAYKLSELAGGWNKISSIDLSTVQAPQAVKDDIIAQLMQGVYIK